MDALKNETTVELERLVNIGLTPAEALDYYFLEEVEKKPNEWADVRGRKTESIRKNYRQGRSKIEEKKIEEMKSN